MNTCTNMWTLNKVFRGMLPFSEPNLTINLQGSKSLKPTEDS